MMKFFRKHMKYFLVFGTVFLMIVFVGGSALQSMCQPETVDMDQVVAEAFGEDVTLADMLPANNKLGILERMGVNWNAPWIIQLQAMNLNRQQLFSIASRLPQQPLSEDEWYMLVRLSEENGTYVSTQELENFKQLIGLTPEVMNRLRENLRVSIHQIDDALTAFIRVLNDASQVSTSAVASEADIRGILREAEEKIAVDGLIVDSGNFVDPEYTPTDEEITAHFEEFKNEPAASSAFGYQIPEKAKIEYIRIDPEKLIAQQTVSDDEAWEHWEANKSSFFQPQEEVAEGEDAPVRKNYKTFTEAKSDVVEALKKEKARQEALGIARDLITTLSIPWAEQPEKDGVKEIPESQRPGEIYPNLIASHRDQYPETMTFVRTEYMDADAFRQDEGIAGVTAPGQRGLPLAMAAFYVPGSSYAPQDGSAQDRLFRNLYQTAADPFVGRTGENEGFVYVMRTVNLIEPHAPEEITEELRTQIVQDIRQKKAYDEAARLAKDLASTVTSDNRLREAFLAHEELQEKLPNTAFVEPDPFSRKRMFPMGGMVRVQPGFIPTFGYDPALMDEIGTMVEKHRADGSQPVITYEQESSGRWLVIQLERVLPITTDTYEDMRMAAMNHVQEDRIISLINQWYDPENLRERVGWKELREDADGEDGEGTEQADGEATASL